MKNIFTIDDVKRSQRFPALTQGEKETQIELVETCNAHNSQITGFVETRRSVLHNRFDRDALRDYVELVPHFDKSNTFTVKLAKQLLEKFSRDIVREYMVEDFVAGTKQQITHFNGDIEKTINHIEGYMTCGKLVPMAQTWKELSQELEEGKVIYYEPSENRAI